MVNLWRDNEEHSESVDEEVIGSVEGREHIHDDDEEDQEEEDVISNFETDDNNGDDDDGLEGEYENDNQMTTGYAWIIMVDNLLTQIRL